MLTYFFYPAIWQLINTNTNPATAPIIDGFIGLVLSTCGSSSSNTIKAIIPVATQSNISTIPSERNPLINAIKIPPIKVAPVTPERMTLLSLHFLSSIVEYISIPIGIL